MNKRELGLLLMGVCIFGVIVHISFLNGVYSVNPVMPQWYQNYFNSWLSMIPVSVFLLYSIYLVKNK